MATVVVKNGNVDGALRTLKQKNAKEEPIYAVTSCKLVGGEVGQIVFYSSGMADE